MLLSLPVDAALSLMADSGQLLADTVLHLALNKLLNLCENTLWKVIKIHRLLLLLWLL